MAVLCCWSAKGGPGVTTLVAVLGRVLGAGGHRPLLVDLDGDLPGVLGLAEGDCTGVADWLGFGVSSPPDALARLEVEFGSGCSLLPRGQGPLDAAAAGLLAQVVAASGRPVIVDAGRLRPHDPASVVGLALAARADQSWLVTDTHPQALARAAAPAGRVTGIVLSGSRPVVGGGRRPLLPGPIVADLGHDPRLARAGASGLAHARVPVGVWRLVERAWRASSLDGC